MTTRPRADAFCLLLATQVIASSTISCSDGGYGLSNSAIERQLLAETPVGSPRATVDQWMRDRRIPGVVIPLDSEPGPQGTTLVQVGEMNNEGRFLDRDVDVFYFFDAADGLITIRVKRPRYSSGTWRDRFPQPTRAGADSFGSMPTQPSRPAWIEAQYQPGYFTFSTAWRVAIEPDGSVSRWLGEPPGCVTECEWRLEGTEQLSEERLRNLQAAVERTRFLELAGHYSVRGLETDDGVVFSISHLATFIVTVFDGESRNSVDVHGARYIAEMMDKGHFHPHHEEIARFLQIWAMMANVARHSEDESSSGVIGQEAITTR